MSRSSRRGARRRAARAVAAAGVVALSATVGGLALPIADASSHREAPLIAADPGADNTDVYAFVSPDKPDTVTIVANWFGLQEPNGGPNFYPWATDAAHDINIDNDGNGKPDISYRFDFTTDDRRGTNTFLYNNGPVTSLNDENLLFRQNYTLSVSHGANDWRPIERGQVAPSDTGPALMPDYDALRKQATHSLPGGGSVYVGASEDPFFLDLRVFDLLYGGDLSEVGTDTLAGTNVNTVVLQVPMRDLALKNDPARNPVIGVWSDTERRTLQLSPGAAKATGPSVQVSRLGNPLVNELVVPSGLKDAFNGLEPVGDAGVPQVVQRVTNPELAQLIQQIYKVPAPATPRNDLVEIFLTGIAKKAPTLDGSAPPIQADLNSQVLNADAHVANFRPSEMLRLNMSVPVTATPNRLGVLGGDLQGFPNGRRLADDVVDIELQAVVGAAQTGKLVDALAAGDKVDANDVTFSGTFPYVALPAKSTTETGASNGATAPAGAGTAQGGEGMPWMPVAAGGTGAAALVGIGGWLLMRRRANRLTDLRPPRY
ncbi:DUF4331 domain-containing protein [Nocardia mexicana]|uniref:Uncharacterized protein DUF4331 n=1 Tax=Nocardia mexicana TaxID=279262 RepID=A0A370HA03_9NOCA|nr:DUF4331 domain-containing protein [Nocardia mexicana]RDI52834.1 uncharacterized protein DUF4331 [Nocardia mexicana]